MRKAIAAINMSLDGYCDHTAMVPDEEIHRHYAALLENAGVILYGRITYQLMQYWQSLLENPSEIASMNEFARAIDKVPKIVFSRTLENTGWDSAELARQSPEEVVRKLKNKPGKDIFIGCRSLINQLLKLQLIDELQICIHPVVAGRGLPLFDTTEGPTRLRLVNTKTFRGGAVILFYKPEYK